MVNAPSSKAIWQFGKDSALKEEFDSEGIPPCSMFHRLSIVRL
jgi:hypothetical protein